MTIYIGKFIENNNLWLVPIVTVILGVMFKLLENDTIDNVFSVFDFGQDLITSAIILLVVNYQSASSVWLLLLFFIISMGTSVFRRHTRNHDDKISPIGIAVTITVGALLVYFAVAYISSDITFFDIGVNPGDIKEPFMEHGF